MVHANIDRSDRVDTTPGKFNRFGFPFIEILMAMAVVAVLVWMLLPRVGSGPPSSRIVCMNNLKNIALTLHMYHDHYHALPPAYTVDEKGNPLHSWRTLILPFLEQQPLYESIDLTKLWNHPANAHAMKIELSIYHCQNVGKSHFTTFMAVATPESCIRPGAESALKTSRMG